jgi:hypothetical protein
MQCGSLDEAHLAEPAGVETEFDVLLICCLTL